MPLKITPGQMKRIYQLLNQTGKMDAKVDLVKHYTKGRETSTKEMLYFEATELIKHLEAFQKQEPIQKIPTSEQLKNQACDRMRKKIIAMLREIGYEKYSPAYNRNVADMDRIYKLINKVGYLEKPLNQYTDLELPKLVSQMESIYTKDIKKKIK
jgi:hypothetical protein